MPCYFAWVTDQRNNGEKFPKFILTDYGINIKVSALRTGVFLVFVLFCFNHTGDVLTSEEYFKWVMVLGCLTTRYGQLGLWCMRKPMVTCLKWTSQVVPKSSWWSVVSIINDIGHCRKSTLEAKFRLQSRRPTCWRSTIRFCDVFLVPCMRSRKQPGIMSQCMNGIVLERWDI